MNELELVGDLIGIIIMVLKMVIELVWCFNFFDIMLDQCFFILFDQDLFGGVLDLLVCEIGLDVYYEIVLNMIWWVLCEQKFCIGSQILCGSIGGQIVGVVFFDLVDVVIEILLFVVQVEIECKYGDMFGCFVVLGMGKFGGCEFVVDSDLDIIIIYDGDEMIQIWFLWFIQRFVSVLFVLIEEGEFYEIDMQLRLLGNFGLVVVCFLWFEFYYCEEVWIWEMMVLIWV